MEYTVQESMSFTTRLTFAVIYCLLGLSGYFVLTTPSYGTAVFPASGFALAAMVYCGRKNVALSIVAGSVLLQFALGLYLSHTVEVGKIDLYLVIACGAALQAWIGHGLASMFLGRDKYANLENSYDSLKFFVLTGCVATLVSTTVGNTGLWLYGLLDSSEFFYSWISWYIGDSLGVIACYPIAISFITRENNLWNYRRFRILAPTLVMLTVLIGGVHGFNNWSNQEEENRLSADGYLIREKIVDSLGSHEAVLVALANFVEAGFDPIHQSINPSIHQSINPSIHQSINPSIHQSINPSIITDLKTFLIDF
jgi:MASE1